MSPPNPPPARAFTPSGVRTTSSPDALRFLVVDGDGGHGATLAEALAAEGHTVVLEPTAEGGLERLDRRAFDVVVIDTDPAGLMDGLALCYELWRMKRTQVRVITSARATAGLPQMAARVGAHGYLPMPCGASELLAVVAPALRRALAGAG